MVKKRLNLYLLGYSIFDQRWEGAEGFVIVCPTALSARQLAQKIDSGGNWMNTEATIIKKIGVASVDWSKKPGIILDSYRRA